jgi:transcription elongation GreA/GreB family factor
LTAADLVALADSLQLDSLEGAWEQASADPGSLTTYQKTLEVLCEQDAAGSALKLGTGMVEALAAKGRVADAIRLAAVLLNRGAHNDSLNKKLHELLKAEYGAEGWFEVLAKRAGLSDSANDPDSLAQMVALIGYSPGHAVYHRAGWGEGVVTAFHSESREITVKFADGREQQFPLDTVLDSFKALPADDIRSMRLLARDELERLAADEPSALIRIAANLYRGRISSTEVKKELCPSIIPTKKWTSFWKGAKAAAAHDPWLLVEGSTTRPVFIIRKKPVGLVDEARRSVDHADDLGQAVGIFRDYLERTTDATMRQEMFDLAKNKVEAAHGGGGASHAHVLDGVLFLNEHGVQTDINTSDELAGLLMEDELFNPRRIEELATQESRNAAIRLLPAALGDTWVDRCLEVITDIPGTVVEEFVNLLIEHNAGHRLLECWDRIAPFPRRHPVLTYHTCRLHADGAFEGKDNAPDRITVCRVGLHLARVLTEEKVGNPQLGRLLTRTVSLLTGRRALLAKALDDITRDELSSFLGITERAGAEYPQEITVMVLRTVADKYPDLTSQPEKPFWQLPYIFVTAAGLARQKEEYRILVDDKIPANSQAIGAAASLGDLSENSEWESAMEEQRNLTGRAKEMDTSLRAARLLEHQEIPVGIVAPGTKVRVSDAAGESQEFTILGPWDCIEDGTINYMAPLAQALLGKVLGQTAQIPDGSPGGKTVDVQIDSIELVI